MYVYWHMRLLVCKISTNFLPHYWKYRYRCHQLTGVAPIHTNLLLLFFCFGTFFLQYFTISAFHFLFLFLFLFVAMFFIVVFWNCFAHLPVHQAYEQRPTTSICICRPVSGGNRHQWQLAFCSKSYHTAFQFHSLFIGYCRVCHTFSCCSHVHTCMCVCVCVLLPNGLLTLSSDTCLHKIINIYALTSIHM